MASETAWNFDKRGLCGWRRFLTAQQISELVDQQAYICVRLPRRVEMAAPIAPSRSFEHVWRIERVHEQIDAAAIGESTASIIFNESGDSYSRGDDSSSFYISFFPAGANEHFEGHCSLFFHVNTLVCNNIALQFELWLENVHRNRTYKCGLFSSHLLLLRMLIF